MDSTYLLHFLPFNEGAYLLASYHSCNSKPSKGVFRKCRKAIKPLDKSYGVNKLQYVIRKVTHLKIMIK